MSASESREAALDELRRHLDALLGIAHTATWATAHGELSDGWGDPVSDEIREGAELVRQASRRFACATGMLESRQRREGGDS